MEFDKLKKIVKEKKEPSSKALGSNITEDQAKQIKPSIFERFINL